jgi:hypothetical protein
MTTLHSPGDVISWIDSSGGNIRRIVGTVIYDSGGKTIFVADPIHEAPHWIARERAEQNSISGWLRGREMRR